MDPTSHSKKVQYTEERLYGIPQAGTQSMALGGRGVCWHVSPSKTL
ncbi:hypothetical protein Dalk_5126 [Desulfatibacillum aliphaticivorans]|uniref:Uncharacterized protein n=1 Tax=Desulfatibacillum aliphaticivorans TaxID=218208 RepID=B8FE16_DESAL|nr:hypothetical protein Dalk_5126 [Desulfatibacillum aliphaticivorans]